MQISNYPTNFNNVARYSLDAGAIIAAVSRIVGTEWLLSSFKFAGFMKLLENRMINIVFILFTLWVNFYSTVSTICVKSTKRVLFVLDKNILQFILLGESEHFVNKDIYPQSVRINILTRNIK